MDMEGEEDLLQLRDMADAWWQGKDAVWTLPRVGAGDLVRVRVRDLRPEADTLSMQIKTGSVTPSNNL